MWFLWHFIFYLLTLYVGFVVGATWQRRRHPPLPPRSAGQEQTRAAAEANAAHHPRVVSLRFVRAPRPRRQHRDTEDF